VSEAAKVHEDWKQFVHDRNVRVARLFGTEDGERVLMELEEETIGLPIFRPAKVDVMKDIGPRDEALYAAWREGQNHLIRTIRDKIRLAESGKR